MTTSVERAARSRAAQGLAPKIVDPAAIARLVELLNPPTNDDAPANGKGVVKPLILTQEPR